MPLATFLTFQTGVLEGHGLRPDLLGAWFLAVLVVSGPREITKPLSASVSSSAK